jgi:hypothetical protein
MVLCCLNEKEAAKLFGLYLDHKISLPKLENSGEGMKVNVNNNSMNCTFQLWKAQDKVHAEAIYYKLVRQYINISKCPCIPKYYIFQPVSWLSY